MNLPVIPADKANHAVYGALAASLGSMHSVAIGAGLCALLAIGKEVYDRVSRKGTPDIMDAVWTLAGGALVLAPLAAWRAGVFA